MTHQTSACGRPIAAEYDASFYDAQSFGSLQSARVILPELLRYHRPATVIDIGCGVGPWLRVAAELGAQTCIGVDGGYVPRDALMIPADCFLPTDLTAPGLADRVLAVRPDRFDLAICVEVAEHLAFERSAGFVADLCRLSDVVLFSAAIPFQHGTGHVNEQWPEFWATHFRAHGYVCFDLLRPEIWGKPDVEWWYAQNLLIFVREGSETAGRFPAEAAAAGKPLAMVHPEAWLSSVLNLWRPQRRDARGEEEGDFRAVRAAWISGARLTPALQAVERARAAPPSARNVFPFTRMEVAEPEVLIDAARREHRDAESRLVRLGDAVGQLCARLEPRMHGVDGQSAQSAHAASDVDALLVLAESLAGALRSERDTLLTERESWLAREQVLQADLERCRAANHTLRQQVTQRDMRMAEMHKDAANRVATLEGALAAAKAQVSALHGSTSWRVTRPLRSISRLLR